MRSLYRLLFLFLTIGFCHVVTAKGTAVSVEKKQMDVSFDSSRSVDSYLRYKTVKGDSIKSVLRRLRLFPIFSQQGSFQHFVNLNPKLSKRLKEDANAVAPEGLDVTLPITEAPFPYKKGPHQWLVKLNYVYFINPKDSKGPDDYTQILNLKKLAQIPVKTSPGVKNKAKKRGLASIEAEPKLKVGSRGGTPEAAQWNFGQPVVRIPLQKGTWIYNRIVALGIPIPPVKKGEPYAYIEIPMYQSQVLLRQPQAVMQNTTKAKIGSNYSLGAKVVSGSRLYTITDATGGGGDIGIDPTLGLEVDFYYKQSWLDLQAFVNFQTENFKPDSTILIDQTTNTRYDVLLRQYFSFWNLKWGLGAGYSTSPSFYTSATNTLESKHVARPYAQVYMGKGFVWSQDVSAIGFLAYDQMFGVEDGPHKLESGYRVNLGLNNRWDLSSSLKLSGDFIFQYQDDKPATYEQTSTGFQMLFGVQWLIGGP